MLGLWSSWNGHSATNSRPFGLSARWSPINLTMSVASRTRWRSSDWANGLPNGGSMRTSARMASPTPRTLGDRTGRPLHETPRQGDPPDDGPVTQTEMDVVAPSWTPWLGSTDT